MTDEPNSAGSLPDILQIGQCGRAFRVLPGRNRDFWGLVVNGGWEPETFAIFERFIDKRHSYIDIGAWIGPTLLFGCQLAGSAYAIEPDPFAYSELDRNVALNMPLANNVRAFNLCIAPKSGKVRFGNRSQGGDSMSSLLFGQENTSWIVDGLTFEDFIERENISDCSFIKIDIEGGEYSILPTMSKYLERQRPSVYLSLHPGFLAASQSSGLIGKLHRAAVRFGSTLKVLRCVNFYKHLYDSEGNRLTLFRLLRMCRRGNFSVVITDIPWDRAQVSTSDAI